MEQESKTARKMAQVKERRGVEEQRKETFADKGPSILKTAHLVGLPSLPLPLLSVFGSRFISRAVKTENPLGFFLL